MKQKFLFILPRLAVLTLLIGASSVVLFLLFKLLITVVAIGAITLIAGKIISKARQHWLNNESFNQSSPFGPRLAQQPVSAQRSTAAPAIIPIN